MLLKKELIYSRKEIWESCELKSKIFSGNISFERCISRNKCGDCKFNSPCDFLECLRYSTYLHNDSPRVRLRKFCSNMIIFGQYTYKLKSIVTRL